MKNRKNFLSTSLVSNNNKILKHLEKEKISSAEGEGFNKKPTYGSAPIGFSCPTLDGGTYVLFFGLIRTFRGRGEYLPLPTLRVEGINVQIEHNHFY